ncbi:MAG: adenylate kinase [Clostridia bacterium]|nr:adenylate kinase [Clostridia bacterium]
MKLILLGPPAAGKGTQAECITDRYGLAHISTGDMLRSEIAAGTELGKLAKSLIDDGNLVPDDIIIAMVEKRIAEDDCKSGFLLDGFPRTIAQAQALEAISEIDAVLDIDVDSELIINRVSSRRVCPGCGHTQSVQQGDEEVCSKCGSGLVQRADDTPERMRHRLEVYRESTLPLINFYVEREKLVPIDGARAIKEVSSQIFDFMDGMIAKASREDYRTDEE